MTLQDLKKPEQAPAQGQMLAYTRQKVIFRPYEGREKVTEVLGNSELLELHLFDEQKEYRCVASGSSRFPSGVIETVADFSEEDERTLYREDVLLEDSQEEITVLNHIAYNEENGMAYVDNYRLKMRGRL